MALLLSNKLSANVFHKTVKSPFEALQEVQRVKAVPQNAEAEYQLGVECLLKAKQSQFHDKQALVAAYNHFNAAIRKDSQDVRYLTSMAHLQLLIGKNSLAAQYLNKALAIDPTNPETLLLQADLQKMQSVTPQMLRQARWHALEARINPASEADFDRLYDDLEDFVQNEVKLMMQTCVSPELSLELAQVDAQEEVYEQLQALQELIQDKLFILNQDLETQSIERMLAPLSQLQERYRQALENHAKFQILMDGINYAFDQTEDLMASEGDKRPEPDLDMEALLDLCDNLADELDQFSESVNIALLEDAYNDLLQQVQKLQEQLDG